MFEDKNFSDLVNKKQRARSGESRAKIGMEIVHDAENEISGGQIKKPYSSNQKHNVQALIAGVEKLGKKNAFDVVNKHLQKYRDIYDPTATLSRQEKNQHLDIIDRFKHLTKTIREIR